MKNIQHMDVCKNNGTLKSSILKGFSINKTFISGYHHFRKPPYRGIFGMRPRTRQKTGGKGIILHRSCYPPGNNHISHRWEKNKSASHMPWGYELIVPRTGGSCFYPSCSRAVLKRQTMINDRRSQIPQIHSETRGAWRRCHSNCATGRGREGRRLAAVGCHTLDGRSPANQLRLVVFTHVYVYPIISRVLCIPGCCLGFLPSAVFL